MVRKRRNAAGVSPYKQYKLKSPVMEPVVTATYKTEQDTPFGGADFVTPAVAAHNRAARLLEINSTLQAGTPGDWTTVGFPMQSKRRASNAFIDKGVVKRQYQKDNGTWGQGTKTKMTPSQLAKKPGVAAEARGKRSASAKRGAGGGKQVK